MKVKMLKKFLEEFDEELEVFYLEENKEIIAHKITKIGIPENGTYLLLGSGRCPHCEGEK